MKLITHLLDSNAWIWFFNQDPRTQTLPTRLPADVQLGIAAITIREAAMLESKGRVAFQPNLEDRVHEMLARGYCEIVPLLPEIAIASTRLPGFHGDPMDRMVVATAIYTGATLVTSDGKILAWAAVNAVPTLAV